MSAGWPNAPRGMRAVAYLSSSDADYVHGHVLVVDGGWLAI